MTMVAAPLMVGMSLLQGVSAIQQGQATAKAYKAQATQAQYDAEAKKQDDDIAAQNAGITAEQQQALRLQDLARTTGTIRASLASRNLDLSSPSAGAIQGAAEDYAGQDIGRLRFNAAQTADAYKRSGINTVNSAATQAAVYRNRASAAMAAGYTSAAGSLLKAGTQANSAGWFG
jgi:hypothetical protein